MSTTTGQIVLQNRTLRWSRPALLNDPFDIQFDLHVDANVEAAKLFALQRLWDFFHGKNELSEDNVLATALECLKPTVHNLTKDEFDQKFSSALDEGHAGALTHLPELHRQLAELNSQTKILSLTVVPDSIPMWAYYAESHKGIVLRIKPKRALGGIWGLAKPVNYIDKMPRLFDADSLTGVMSGEPIDPLKLLHLQQYTKALAWAHEKEWRILDFKGRNAEAEYDDGLFHQEELDAVILGCRMTDEDKNLFAEIVSSQYPEARVLQAQPKSDVFELSINEYVSNL